MCAVEDLQVEAKMIEIGRLVEEASQQGHAWRRVQRQLQGKSVELANRFRVYLGGEYGVELRPTTRPVQIEADPTANGGVRLKP
jgi:hypothetical protein